MILTLISLGFLRAALRCDVVHRLSTTVILYSVNKLWITQLLNAAQGIQVAAVAAVDGARSRNRTGTLVKARDFKSLVSTYFTIRAAVSLVAAALFLIRCY